MVHGLSCMWDLPRPGLEPVSPALAGGFLTTAPPGKSYQGFLFVDVRITHFPTLKSGHLPLSHAIRRLSPLVILKLINCSPKKLL